MKAFVLAAGYATRLHPLTLQRPKALLDVAGKPILTRILERVAMPELSEIVVVVTRRFADSFEGWRRSYTGAVPLRLLCDGSTEDANKLGALGDLAFALDEVPLQGEDFLVVAGDNLLEFALEPILETFARRREPLILVREVPELRSPSPYNEVTLDAAGRVLRFREKPLDPQTPLAAIAFYAFPHPVEGLLRRYLAEGGSHDAPGFFLEWLVGRAPVWAQRLPGGWFDVGSFDSLEAARRHFSG